MELETDRNVDVDSLEINGNVDWSAARLEDGSTEERSCREVDGDHDKKSL